MKPVIIAVIIVILVVAIGALMVTPEKEIVSDIDEPIINNFEECIAAGNHIQDNAEPKMENILWKLLKKNQLFVPCNGSLCVVLMVRLMVICVC